MQLFTWTHNEWKLMQALCPADGLATPTVPRDAQISSHEGSAHSPSLCVSMEVTWTGPWRQHTTDWWSTSLDGEEKRQKCDSQCCFMISTESIKWKLRETLLKQDANYTLTGPRAETRSLLWTSSHWDWTQSSVLKSSPTGHSRQPRQSSRVEFKTKSTHCLCPLRERKKKRRAEFQGWFQCFPAVWPQGSK